jgi:hypothetical protein
MVNICDEFVTFLVIYAKVTYLGPAYLGLKPKVVINDDLGHKGICVHHPNTKRTEWRGASWFTRVCAAAMARGLFVTAHPFYSTTL